MASTLATITDIGGTLVGIGSAGSLFESIFGGGDKTGQPQETRRRQERIYSQASVYKLMNYTQYFNWDVLNNLIQNSTRFNQELDEYFQGLNNALHSVDTNFDNPLVQRYKAIALNDIRKIDQQTKANNPYNGLDTDLTSGKTSINQDSFGTNPINKAGFSTTTVLLLVAAIGGIAFVAPKYVK